MSFPLEYRTTLVDLPGYLHARVEGPRSPENVARFLREVREACARLGKTAVLVDIGLIGPSLGAANAFQVIAQGSVEARGLRRIAYVETGTGDAAIAKFAETVAINRGLNVRLFGDVDAAHAWMREGTR